MKTRSQVYENSTATSGTDGPRISRKRHLNNAEITSSESYFNAMFEKDAFRLFDGTDLVNETCDFTNLTSENLMAEWQLGDWNQWNETKNFELSPLSPPVTPQPKGCPPQPLVDIPPFEMFFDSLPSESALPLEKTQLFEDLAAAEKRSKRELSRKCRKVYGIDNKKSWCTQCRWKKACTRFNK